MVAIVFVCVELAHHHGMYLRVCVCACVCVCVCVRASASAFAVHAFCLVVVVLCLVLNAAFLVATNDSFLTQLTCFELELYIFYALVLCYLPHDPCSRFFIR